MISLSLVKYVDAEFNVEAHGQWMTEADEVKQGILLLSGTKSGILSIMNTCTSRYKTV